MAWSVDETAVASVSNSGTTNPISFSLIEAPVSGDVLICVIACNSQGFSQGSFWTGLGASGVIGYTVGGVSCEAYYRHCDGSETTTVTISPWGMYGKGDAVLYVVSGLENPGTTTPTVAFYNGSTARPSGGNLTYPGLSVAYDGALTLATMHCSTNAVGSVSVPTSHTAGGALNTVASVASFFKSEDAQTLGTTSSTYTPTWPSSNLFGTSRLAFYIPITDTASPDVITVNVGIQDPTLTPGAVTTDGVDVIGVSFTIHSPTLGIVQTAKPAPLSNTVTIHSPSVTGGATTLDAPLTTVNVQVHDAAASGTGPAYPPVITVDVAIHDASVSLDNNIPAPVISVLVTLHSPALTTSAVLREYLVADALSTAAQASDTVGAASQDSDALMGEV